MKTNYNARKCTLKESFYQRADRKLEKVGRFFGDDSVADVTVSYAGDNQIVEITVKQSGLIFRAEEEAIDRIEALDKAVDSLIRQIRKNKTKVERKLRDYSFNDVFGISDDEAEETEYDIVREKEVSLKPEFLEEAILQMNLLAHNFYMFFNAETDEINVVYKRKDGKYGLLIPDMQ